MTTPGANGRIAFTSGRTTASPTRTPRSGSSPARAGTATRFTTRSTPTPSTTGIPPGPPTARRSPTRRATQLSSPALDIWVHNVDGTGRTNITLGRRRPRTARPARRTARGSPTRGAGDRLARSSPSDGRLAAPRCQSRGHRHRRPLGLRPRPAWSPDSSTIYYGRAVGATTTTSTGPRPTAATLAGTARRDRRRQRLPARRLSGRHEAVLHPEARRTKDVLHRRRRGQHHDSRPATAGGRRLRVRVVAGQDEDRVRPRASDAGEILMRNCRRDRGADRSPTWRQLRRQRRVGAERFAHLQDASVDRGLQRVRLDPAELRRPAGRATSRRGLGDDRDRAVERNAGAVQQGDPSTVIYTPNLELLRHRHVQVPGQRRDLGLGARHGRHHRNRRRRRWRWRADTRAAISRRRS